MSKDGYKLIHLAAKEGHQSLLSALVEQNANINEKTLFGETPLRLAQMNKHEELALEMIKSYKAKLR